ncbi:MAG: hypothetical protein HY812_06830 [Planctomycetes bacterium]|nr:hypothetical protein [Planctomycetota bacterium]
METKEMSAKARQRPLTAVQKRYLRFIQRYSAARGVAPSFSDIEHGLCVTSPSAHRMVLTLEKRGALGRVPGRARSLQLLLPPEAFAEDSGEPAVPERGHGYLRNALRQAVDAGTAGRHLAVALGILRPGSERRRPSAGYRDLGRRLRPVLVALASAGVLLRDGDRYRWNDEYSSGKAGRTGRA